MSSPADLCGFLNVDKPVGWSSRQAVDCVKRLVKPAKVGHAGTLDPIAGGVLIVCIGQATRLVPFLHEFRKSYRGEFLWGHSSETDDIEGDVRELTDAPVVSREQLLAVLPRFVGRITQTPPIYSAVKIDGQRAYKLARKGRTPDVQPREVDVFRVDLLEFDPPRLVLEIECGTGTYIRSLGRDIARAVGSDAVMSGLVRTQIGPFGQETSVRPPDITAETVAEVLVPAAAAVSHLTTVVCDAAMIAQLRHGRPVGCPDSLSPAEGEPCALVSSSGGLVAIGEFREQQSQIAPRQVFA